jgi:glycosyltransferase involved in cell wall biosynthesis
MPAVTIVTPTHRRHRLLERQHRIVLAQRLEDLEWLILDDSPEPSPYFLGLKDRRVRYHHHAGARMSIGAKRNWLAERAASAVIAHFDDDDYYAPDYLKTMLAQLARDRDIVKLSAWFLFATSHDMLGYWDTSRTSGLHYRISPQGIQMVRPDDELKQGLALAQAGFGFSYVYRKTLWERIGFPDRDFAEDHDFVTRAQAGGGVLELFADRQGLCLHIVRKDNISACYPQFLLPGFVVEKLFGPAALELLA